VTCHFLFLKGRIKGPNIAGNIRGVKMSKNKQLIKIFEYALNQEETGKSFYENSLKKMEISSAKNAIIRLIEEEEKHIEMIKRILKGLNNGPELEPSDIRKVTIKKKNFFDKRTKSNFLKQINEYSSVIDASIFNTAWLLEKDISEFYTMMSSQTDGETKKVLFMLAQWEKSHEEFFKEYRDRLLQFYSNLIQE